MHINTSQKNSERILFVTKQLTNFGQNYFTQSNQSSSVKKLVSAFLLVPVIIPTAITTSLIACTYFFLNAVSAKESNFILSKLAKGILRFLIYVAAIIILVPCIILNLAVSLIPVLIFLAINKNVANDKNGQTEVKVDSSEYNKLIAEKTVQLGDEQPDNRQELLKGVDSDNQQVVETISRDTGSEKNVDQTTVIHGINNQDFTNGKAIIRMIGDENNVAMKGIITGDIDNQSAATALTFGCQIVSDGIDFQLCCSARIGNNQREATERLIQNESVQTMLSGNNGILSMEQYHSPQQSLL